MISFFQFLFYFTVLNIFARHSFFSVLSFFEIAVFARNIKKVLIFFYYPEYFCHPFVLSLFLSGFYSRSIVLDLSSCFILYSTVQCTVYKIESSCNWYFLKLLMVCVTAVVYAGRRGPCSARWRSLHPHYRWDDENPWQSGYHGYYFGKNGYHGSSHEETHWVDNNIYDNEK